MTSGRDPARLAIHVVTHDSTADMPGWLDAVDALPQRDRIDVCVVDSGSSPAERERLAAITEGRISRLLLRPNVGYGAACNAGAAATAAPALLFTTPDVRVVSVPEEPPPPGTIAGGYVIEDGIRRPGAFSQVPFARRQIAHLLLGGRSRAYVPTEVDPKWVSGGALLIGREDLARLGGWSEDYFLYFEDADLCLRHTRTGGRIDVAPGLVVTHPPDVDRTAIDAVAYRSGRRFVARHQGRRYVAGLWVALVIAYLPRRVVRQALRLVLDTVAPSRIERRLGVPPDRAARA